jgi:hypothetical protein
LFTTDLNREFLTNKICGETPFSVLTETIHIVAQRGKSLIVIGIKLTVPLFVVHSALASDAVESGIPDLSWLAMITQNQEQETVSERSNSKRRTSERADPSISSLLTTTVFKIPMELFSNFECLDAHYQRFTENPFSFNEDSEYVYQAVILSVIN